MHISSKEDPVEIKVQGRCTISGIIFRIVQMVHAISGRPKFGLRSYGRRIS